MVGLTARSFRHGSTFWAFIAVGLAFVMEQHKAPDPVKIGFLGADTIMFDTNLFPHLVEQARLLEHGVYPSLVSGIFLQYDCKIVKKLKVFKRDWTPFLACYK